MDSVIPSEQDFVELQRLFESAKKVIGETSWKTNYPKYPDEIWVLMNYIQGSAWCDTGYKISEVDPIFQRIADASMDEVRCVLTGFSRGERFCDGYIASLFADEKFEPVICRARELTRS